MNNAKSAVIIALFAFVPYLLVAWLYVYVTDGGSKQFWSAMGLLLIVRLFFSVIEFLGGVLAWRLHGKRVMVQRFLDALRTNNFPKRVYAHDDFLNYLARIQNDRECSTSTKVSAKEFESALAMCESLGIVLGMRMHSAAEEALEKYSPRAGAQIYGASAA